jgi:hypothetical protein
MKRISGEESKQRWKSLTARAAKLNSSESVPQQAVDDPFDCSDLVVPTIQTLVDESTKKAIQQWKDLQERKVHKEVIVDETAPRKRGRPEGWTNANRLHLADFFDYETRLPVPPQDDDGTGEKVVSLQDPSIHLSFETELWNIFKNVDTLQEMEAKALNGAACHNSRRLHKEVSEGILKQSRMDCHGLSRFRMSDRHEAPSQCNSGEAATTIRLECWKRHIKRGSSPDGNRLVLEFLASQTLQDVHDVIVELSNDALWEDSIYGKETASGLFLIEDTFYTTGNVNYSTTIMTWLNDTSAGVHRRAFLGLPVNQPLEVKSMSSIRLEQLQWRLGVRYFHAHHGDVECSVFLTDMRQGKVSHKTTYPLVHDVWSPTYSMAECEACRRRVGVLCTSAGNKVTDGGPRALCEMCFKQLYPSGDAPSSTTVMKYSIWRDQEDLSVGHQKKDAPF